MLDRNAPDYAPRPLPLSVNLFNKTKDSSVVSGLASNGKELYVSDSRDNVIRVATLEPLKTFYRVDAANNGVKIADQAVELPAGDARLAPAIVYQTQRVGEGVSYIIPDLKPGASYTARCHLAEFNKKEPQYRGISINYNAGDNSVNVQELAGGMFKAYIQDFPNLKANAEGKASISFSGRPFGLCALEIFDDQQKRVFAVNCGGPPVGDFKGESEELVDRAWKFERPGPMAFDKRGDLWIVQCGNDFPLGSKMEAKYKASIKCYKTDGTFTGRQITDVVNPRALGYDPIKDQLLVAENGPDLNVRVYSGLESTPSSMRTIGQKGGVYAGENPGLINDVAAGGYARFAGVAGVGVDAKGNTYVGGGFQGTDLRQITPEGKLGWMVNSLMFCNTYDFDPTTDGTQLFGTYNNLKLDLAQKQPGKEQKYVSYNWDVRRYGEPDRAGGSQAIVRRLGPDKRRVMYTSGQGNIGDIKIFRYDRYLAIPSGSIRGNDIWIDINGDGKEQPEEVSKMPSGIGWVTTVVVDARGDIYAGCPTTGGSFYRRFFFKGFNDKGVPLYRATQGDGFVDTRFPEEGDKTNAWGMAVRMDYDVESDIMVAFYPAVGRTGEGDKTPPQYFFARYDNWSKGNRVPKWKVKAFTPYTHPDYFMYETDLYPYSGYMGMQVVGDYVFFAYLFGEVHVFDLKTGKLAQIFAVGPEMNGQDAWEDAAMGLRVTKTKAGEYLVLTENSGWGGKNNFFRWKP
ncbi:MAG: hypothetical protein H7232_13940 [Aeromicrobium sp.]|nr:hypothetical protein [Burkholderiales bacterium]